MCTNHVTALILAAGFSTRMQRGFKPLLSLPQSPYAQTSAQEISVLEQVVSVYASRGIRHLYVLTGQREREALRTALQIINAKNTHGIYLEEIHNPHAERGMFSSVCKGLQALQGSSYRHCFIHPIDIPLVRPCTLFFLLNAQRKHPENIHVPTFNGKNGHPLLLPLCHARHVLEYNHLECSQGLKGAIKDLPIIGIPTPDSHILYDMDTDDEYAFLRSRAALQPFLDKDEALALLHCLQVPERGIAHARAVACVAEAFATAYVQKYGSQRMHIPAVIAGAWVHDMCKGQVHHAQAAARDLERMGLELLAPLVEEHMDLALASHEVVGEKELIFMADKFVSGNLLVPVQERFLQKMEIYALDPEAMLAIGGRMQRALNVEKRIQDELDQAPWDLAQQALAVC